MVIGGRAKALVKHWRKVQELLEAGERCEESDFFQGEVVVIGGRVKRSLTWRSGPMKIKKNWIKIKHNTPSVMPSRLSPVIPRGVDPISVRAANGAETQDTD